MRPTEPPHGDVFHLSAHAFDDLAQTYDADFTDTAVGRTLRDMVWARLDRLFPPGARILELGCGTGEDALRLASRGLRVVATDASAEMIQVARAKAAATAQPTAQPVDFQCRTMEHLGDVLDAAPFDGVLSNFGAINCVNDVPGLVRALAPAVKPGARLIWVVMGRHVWWEWAWYLFRGQARKAWRRLRREGVPWRGLTISYPTPRDLTAQLWPYFAVDRASALGFALPPSYAAAWLNRSPRLLSAITCIEKQAQRFPVTAGWADHYIIEATRRPVDASP